MSLIDSVDNMPFDTANERVIVIGDSGTLGARDAERAKEKLREALKIVLEPGFKPVTIVSEAAQARSIDALAPDNPIASEIADMRGLLEQVVKQTTDFATYRAGNNFMFDLIRRLGEKKYLNTAHLKAIGVDLAAAPNDGRVDLGEALAGVIPPPPPKPKPTPRAVDTSSFVPTARSAAPADDDIPF